MIRISNKTRLDPEELATTRALIQGSSGSGKSFLLRLLMEKIASKMPMIVIDPEGELHTVRQVASMLLVGGGGELPVKAGTGAKVARGILEQSCSAIIDLSDLPSRHHSEYVRDFIASMMSAPMKLWRPTILAIDEAHRFCPEGGRDNVAAEQVIDLMSRGRKRGYGGVLLTQRVSKIRKDAIAECANVFIGKTTLDIDVKRAGDMLGITNTEAKFLRNMKPGEWRAYGPCLTPSSVSEFSANLPATQPPKRGQTQGKAVVKDAKTIADLASSIMEAEDEPLTLEDAQRQIKAMQAKIDKAETSKPDPEAISKQLEAVRADAVAEIHAKYHDFVCKAVGMATGIGDAVEMLKQHIESKVEASELTTPTALVSTKQQVPTAPTLADGSLVHRPQSSGNAADLPRGEAAVLSAAIQYEGTIERDTITVLTGYKRSSRDTYIQRLRERGFVETSPGGPIRVTVQGFEAMPETKPMPTGVEKQNFWQSRLGTGEWAVLNSCINAYPSPVHRDRISEDTGYKRSSRDTYIQRLRSLKLVSTQSAGNVIASDSLF